MNTAQDSSQDTTKTTGHSPLPNTGTNFESGSSQQAAHPTRSVEVIERLMSIVLSAIALSYSFLFSLFYAQFNGPIGFDDGYIAAFGERLIDGRWLPYVDAVSQRGPILYWLVGFVQLLSGRYSFYGIRILVGILNFLTVSGCVAIGWVCRRPLAGAIAALLEVFVISCVYLPGSGYGLHGEPAATPFIVLAMAITGYSLRKDKPYFAQFSLLGLAGILLAISGLCKQTLLSLIAPFLLWVFAITSSKSGSCRRSLVSSSAILAGWLTVLVLVLGYYIANDALGDFWYWFYQFNAQTHMEPYQNVRLGRIAYDHIKRDFSWVFILLIGFGGTMSYVIGALFDNKRGSSFIRRYASVGLEATVTLTGLLTLSGAIGQLRFWPHHFLPVIPIFGLAVGLSAHLGWSQLSHHLPSRVAIVAMVVLCTAVIVPVTNLQLYDRYQERKRGRWKKARMDAICKSIHTHTKPSDSIIVWGFAADLYIICKRKPGTRYVFSAPVAGIIPPFWKDPKKERTARDAPDIFLSEIQTNKPEMILDLPITLGGYSINRLDAVHDWLQKEYCSLKSVRDGNRRASIWKRKANGKCPKARSRR